MKDTREKTGTGGGDLAGLGRLAENMGKSFELYQETLKKSLEARAQKAGYVTYDPYNILPAFMQYWTNALSRPDRVYGEMMKLCLDYSALFRHEALSSIGAAESGPEVNIPQDKRFKDPVWAENALFAHLKNTYLLFSEWAARQVDDTFGLSKEDQAKVSFFTARYIEALSPTNFFAANPEVMRETLMTQGENLVRGMTNMLADIERGGGELLISHTDLYAFELGKDIASTPGEVIFENDVLQLIQYHPATSEVKKIPLLIFPPWINKFYILDLGPQKSLVRYLVEQGFSVFVVSWVNPAPGSPPTRMSLEDYMLQGFAKAVDTVIRETGEPQINVAGYCVGGSMLASALSYSAQFRDPRVKSATFFTTQIDFEEAGELKVFVDDETLRMMKEVSDMEGGVLEAKHLATSFNLLRGADLIWNYVLNNYILGKKPFPLDLLYWNADATRMPAHLHLQYLRDYYRDNKLGSDQMELYGRKVSPSDISIPVYCICTEDDHIAPARSVYRGFRRLKGPVRLVLGGSGHIAGVINAPAKNKYHYRTRDDGAPWPDTLEEWAAGAELTQGSWWPDWINWLSERSGGDVPARKPGAVFESIEPAPGSYVRVRADRLDVG